VTRILAGRSLAEVRWVLNRRAGQPIATPEAHWMHIRRTPRPLGQRRVVRHVLNRQGQRRSPKWLTAEQRHQIMPFALWDAGEQIEAAAALFRELTGRPPVDSGGR
jgi:hypothetical protein